MRPLWRGCYQRGGAREGLLWARGGGALEGDARRREAALWCRRHVPLRPRGVRARARQPSQRAASPRRGEGAWQALDAARRRGGGVPIFPHPRAEGRLRRDHGVAARAPRHRGRRGPPVPPRGDRRGAPGPQVPQHPPPRRLAPPHGRGLRALAHQEPVHQRHDPGHRHRKVGAPRGEPEQLRLGRVGRGHGDLRGGGGPPTLR
mmetsp:Transcript_34782/g.109825  ORF Transcript_34782/g.109825 Transcript_34782/m.109825 type:complete len:204 (+) Transcript_34782:800-1411(+)